LLNRAYARSLFWDGRESALETQALRPIEDPLEMGSRVDDVVERLRARKDYREQFAGAFTDGLTAANLGKALASFQRTLLLGGTSVDRFKVGDTAALTSSELHGVWLFESRAKCWKCHSGRNFTDEQFHNTGVSWGKEPVDLGRYAITKNDADRGKFKTPTLRGVALNPPYMHDGSLATLEDVLDFYNRGGGKNPHLDPMMEPLNLSKDEVRDLVAFLKALSHSAGAKK
jgi:cytochrome c peroxidase